MKLLIATPLCLIMGLFAIWLGITTIREPATCDFKTMTASDVCEVKSRGSEELIVNGASHRPSSRHRDLAQQVSYNGIAGPVYVLGGVLFTGTAIWIGTLQVQGLWARHQVRRQPDYT